MFRTSSRKSIADVFACIAALAVTGVLAGCTSGPGEPDPNAIWQETGRETVRPEARPRATDRIILAQTVTGAGEDAMVYNHHFDGAELNSLGKYKLRLMLEDAQFLADPNIYIVSGDTGQLAAVRAYLAEWGLAFEDTRLHAGPNPNLRRSAALGLAQQRKFEGSEMQPSDDGAATTSE